MSYTDFFQSLTGFEPYRYQQKFQALPDKSLVALTAFTGAGKTETVVISWLYERLVLKKAPTRLILQFPLRTLVDQTYRRVQLILANLPAGHGINLCQLMGGSVDNTFVIDISEPTIICGTLDQIISRQLNRSYGLPVSQFPMHFAACNNDCRIFVDETQLQGVAYGTSLALHKLRQAHGILGNVELILSSATLNTHPIREIFGNMFQSIAVGDDEGPYLTGKRTTPKRIKWTKTKWGSSEFATNLVKEVLEQHRPGELTLVVLNQVDAAKDVFAALPSDIEKRLIHGRFRGQEKTKLTYGLEGFRGILITTQCIEAGVDIDASILFTQLSPADSWVQRMGRQDRKGTIGNSICFVIGFDCPKDDQLLPYTRDELIAARDFIRSLEGNGAIANIQKHSIPYPEYVSEPLPQGILKELFVTDINIGSRNISKYVRKMDNTTLSVGWRSQITGNELRKIESVSVPLYQLKRLNPSTIFRWDFKARQWRPTTVNDLNSADTVLLPCSEGGYSSTEGWTGDAKDQPDPVRYVPDFDQRSSYGKTWVTLEQHSQDAADKMQQILSQVDVGFDESDKAILTECALWHDLGKAHEVFQETLTRNYPEQRKKVLAKSPHHNRHRRKGFRHEVASAIAALEQGKSFLFAYLLAAHHGIVRNYLERQRWETDTIRGIKPGETLPGTQLGNTKTQDCILNFTWHWRHESEKLLEAYGPFKLAYLETLIRCADQLASAKK